MESDFKNSFKKVMDESKTYPPRIYIIHYYRCIIYHYIHFILYIVFIRYIHPSDIFLYIGIKIKIVFNQQNSSKRREKHDALLDLKQCTY